MAPKIDKKEVEKIKKNKIVQFILANKTALIAVVLVVAIFIWSNAKIYKLEKSNQQIIEKYEYQLDSLGSTNMQLTAKVFSWAIRGEMIRNNNDNVDQFFIALIKEPTIQKIQLIDHKYGQIILSTNRKEEGLFIDNELILKADDVLTINDSTSYKIACPVMGLNNRLAVVVLDVDK